MTHEALYSLWHSTQFHADGSVNLAMDCTESITNHGTIANNGYDSGNDQSSYGAMSSFIRSHVSNTPIVPSSGMPSSGMLDGYGMSHFYFGTQSIHYSPALSAAPSQHGIMYGNSARHAASYENSSSQHESISYDAQATPMFDLSSTAQFTSD